MTIQHIPASVDTFATLYAAYPSFSARLLALAPTTRVWVEDAACFVHPSANGKHWDYELGGTGPYLAAGKWPGPMDISIVTTTTAITANSFRGLVHRMPNYRARDINRLSFMSNGAAVTPGGTDAFDLRVYLLDPLFRPLAIAPLYVFKYNAAGSGGAGAVSLNIGAGIVQTVFDLPGSVTANLPGLFVLGIIHGFLPATMPAIYVPSLSTATPMDKFSRVLSGSDPTASATFDRTTAWQWTETFAAGAATVWGSVGSPDQTTNQAPVISTKLAN